MTDEIYGFLRSHGPASALAIAQNILRAHGGNEAVAGRIVGRLLSGDARFCQDELGRWSIGSGVASGESSAEPEDLLVCAPVLEYDAGRLAAAQVLCLTMALLSHRKILEIKSFKFFLNRPGREVQRQFRALRALFAGQFCVVADRATPFKSFLHRLAQTCGPIERPPIVPLENLAQRLLASERRLSLEQICRRLQLPWLENAAASERARLRGEIMLALLERLPDEMNLASLLQLGGPVFPVVSFDDFEFDAERVKLLPALPGVYMMFDEYGEVIYIGRAKNLKRRLADYFLHPDTDDLKIRALHRRIKRFEWFPQDTELDARILEMALIQKHRPVVNTQVNILEKRTPQNPESCRIVIMLSALSPDAIIYLFSAAGRYARIVWQAGAEGTRLLRHLIEEICFTAPADCSPSLAETQASEMAWRWWRESADRINWLDPAEAGDAEAVFELISDYLKSPRSLAERVIRR